MSYILTIAGTVLAMNIFHAFNVAAEKIGLIFGEDPEEYQQELIQIALERESR